MIFYWLNSCMYHFMHQLLNFYSFMSSYDTRFIQSTDNVKLECQSESSNIVSSHSECINKLINKLNGILKTHNGANIFLDDSDIEAILKHFLSVFCIDDISLESIKDIDKNINEIREYINEFLSKCKNELYINVKSVCEIFGIIGNANTNFGNRTGSLIWASTHEPPVYLTIDNSSNSIYPKITGTTLVSILNDIKQHVISIKTLPEIMYFGHISDKCNGLTVPNGQLDLNYISNLQNVNDDLKKFVASIAKFELDYPMFSKSGFGLKCPENNEEDDECRDNLPSNNTYNYKYLSMMAPVIQTAADAYWKLYAIIKNALYEFSEYSKMHKKICKVLELFNKSILQSINVDNTGSPNLLKNVIIMSIDLKLFEFSKNYFVDQLEVDRMDQFCIERVLMNIANYYIENSMINKQYFNIHEQDQDVRVTILLFTSLLGYILSERKSFIVPLNILGSISLPLIVGMTMRTQITCPSQEICNSLATSIVEITTHYDQVLFKYANNKIIDKFGKIIELKIDSSLRHILCERI